MGDKRLIVPGGKDLVGPAHLKRGGDYRIRGFWDGYSDWDKRFDGWAISSYRMRGNNDGDSPG